MQFQKARMDDMLQAGRHARPNHRHHAAHVRPDTADHQTRLTTWWARRTRCRTSPTNCAITLRTSRISAGRFAITSTGNRTARTFPSAFRSDRIFDSIDGVDGVSDKLRDLVADLDQIDVHHAAVARSVPADDRNHEEHADHDADHAQHHVRDIRRRWTTTAATSTAMGKAFDNAKNDDTFYIPPEVFKNAGLQTSHGHLPVAGRKAVRMLISQKGDPGFARRDRAGRADQDRRRRSAEGNSTRRR